MILSLFHVVFRVPLLRLLYSSNSDFFHSICTVYLVREQTTMCIFLLISVRVMSCNCACLTFSVYMLNFMPIEYNIVWIANMDVNLDPEKCYKVLVSILDKSKWKVWIFRKNNLFFMTRMRLVAANSGLSLEGDLGEKVSLNWFTSPCFELRERLKCINCIGKIKIRIKTSH